VIIQLKNDLHNQGVVFILTMIQYKTIWFIDRSLMNVYIISELCDRGDVQHLLDEHGHGIISQRQIARIIQSLVQSLKFCHWRNIIHRDVKPSSTFIANSGNSSSWAFKLGNFGVSIWKGNLNIVIDNVGTLGYFAPEMLSWNGFPYEVDIWSAGVVLYVLLCGKKPFDMENKDAKMHLEPKDILVRINCELVT